MPTHRRHLSMTGRGFAGTRDISRDRTHDRDGLNETGKCDVDRGDQLAAIDGWATWMCYCTSGECAAFMSKPSMTAWPASSIKY
jgi:hypothetical protein